MAQHFDLAIIGSGSGNTIVDEQFADRSVALIDAGRFGGTCLNVGCIPTKMFVYPADGIRRADALPDLGVKATTGQVDFGAIRDRIFGRIDPISDGGLAWRQKNPNVTVFTEHARFVGERTLQVGEQTITADQIVVAAGSRAEVPDLPGADDAQSRLHTSDSIMRLDKLPRRLVILGGGFIAAEFAHVFSAFGVEVTVIARGPRLLSREDREISEIFTADLSTRVHVQLRQQAVAFEARPKGVTVVCEDEAGEEYLYDADLVLCAMGRVPMTEGLGCQEAGIEVDEEGFIVVDDHQRTTADGVYALGDVCEPQMLKHVANHQARVVQHNLLHPDDLHSAMRDAIPHAVFSSPQVASVGLTEEQARTEHDRVRVGRQDFADVAYGWAMELPHGTTMCKVIADDERLLGAHIVGPEASMLLQPLVQAMAFGLPVKDLARGQFWPHPALSEVVENALLNLS